MIVPGKLLSPATRAALALAALWLSALPVAAAGEADPGLGPAEFDALRSELDLRRQAWATIPWRVSVTEARALAAQARKPLVLVVNTGNCLGFV
jgi:hypothetical protein